MSTIDTLYGPVVGFEDTFPTHHSTPFLRQQRRGSELPVSKWLGIPYAFAGRWERPRPPNPWATPLQCTQFGPRFPQGLTITDVIYGRKKDLIQNHHPSDESEELGFNLNVFAPAASLNTLKLPVLVWIYGGSLEGGSADFPIYDPTEWMRREAQEARSFIVVTGNYRCNIFGFMACRDLVKEDAEGLAGNYGVYDCIAILQWVQDNIRNFGGDPDNVTIFGESAGAFIIGGLLVTQHKLFQRAILQSGAPESLTHRSVDSKINQDYFTSLLQYFNVPHDLTSEQRIKLLREIPTSKIMEFMSNRGNVINDYGLTIEESSKSSIWSKPVIDLIKDGRWNPNLKSVILGHNEDEGSIFAFLFQTATQEGYENVLKMRCPLSPRNKISKLYPAPEDLQCLQEKTPLPIDWTTCAGSRLLHDQVIEAPMESLALAFDGVKNYLTGESCRVFCYQLIEGLPSIDQGLGWGAFHTVDLALLFNVKTLWDPDSDQARTSAALGALWVTFAQTGLPDPAWPEYSPSTSPIKFFVGKGGTVYTEDMRLTRTELQKQRIQFWNGQLCTIVSMAETVD